MWACNAFGKAFLGPRFVFVFFLLSVGVEGFTSHERLSTNLMDPFRF